MDIPGATSRPPGGPATSAEGAFESAAEPKRLDGETGPVGERSRAARAFIRRGKLERGPNGVTGLETVIGEDDRVRILETELAPWRMICALRLIGKTGSAVGTGWLAGPRTVITVGHCVYHTPCFGGWVDRIEVSAGRNGDAFPFGTVATSRVSTLDRWVETEDPDFDVGCIHLDEPIGDKTGHFGIASLDESELADRLVNISGYSADRGGGQEQSFHSNAVLYVGPRRIFYDVDTYGGQSGAAVWIEQDGGRRTVVGIHAYGTGGTPLDLGIKANSAPRITAELFDVIAGWVERDGACDAGT